MLPIALILLAAVMHVGWNLTIKRGRDPLVAIWFFDLLPPLLFWPVLFVTGVPDAAAWPLAMASAVVHAMANVALAEAYGRADLSVVYPVARGLAPVFVAVGASLALGERLSPPAVLAVLFVGAGVAWLGLARTGGRPARAGLGAAVVWGALIATYAVIDKAGVSRTHPLSFMIVFLALEMLVLTPYVLLRRGGPAVVTVVRREAAPLVAASLVSTAAYVLVLVAMRLTQVTYVAALREVSVVLAAVVGWRLLGEPFGARRVAGAALATAGLVTLALAMAR
jgi:drug/metabolite transporter (DMT)-like permease